MKERLVFWVKKVLFVFLKIFYVCPVRQNRIVFFSYYGRQYSCNPKFLTEYLLANNTDHLDIWWQFLNPEKFGQLEDRGVHLTKYDSLRGILNLMTAKVVVTNVDYPIYVPFRKKQFLINTWHGGGAYKKVATDIHSLVSCRLKTEEQSKKLVNLYISSSSLFTKFVIRGAFQFTGEVLECGMPRNDILLRRYTECLQSCKRKITAAFRAKNRFICPDLSRRLIYTGLWVGFSRYASRTEKAIWWRMGLLFPCAC